MAIDFHYKPTTVKNWVRFNGSKLAVIPVIGIGADQPGLTFKRTGQDGFPHWTIATNQAKDVIYSRLGLSEAGPRYCHFPRGFGYDDQWFRQLTSERAVTKYTRGFPKRVYEKSSGARNEALDIRVYALACADIMRLEIAKLRAQLTKKPEPAKPPTQQRKSWVTGWK